MENKRNCLNCKYFRLYYVLNPSLRFTSAHNGFCCAEHITKTEAKLHFKTGDCCVKWTPRELETLKQQYQIEIALNDIKHTLDNILNVLHSMD